MLVYYLQSCQDLQLVYLLVVLTKNKEISGSGAVGDGLYLHKHDKCYRVQKMKGNGLYLAPYPRFVEGDGLFLKHGNDINDGAGLLMGKNSLFKNIPVLGQLL